LIERELTRKKYLLSLENRTPEQIAEEEALYIEIKRLEQSERKFKKEREALLRTLAGMDSGLPDIVEDDGLSLGITPDGKKKRKGAAMEIDSPATPSTSIAAVVKRPSSKNAAYGIIIPFLSCLYVYKICRRCSTLYHSD
jgi:DNA methyltransferase 1-associated protein 1